MKSSIVSNKRKVYINGYFTAEHINGVPRYAMEIVKRLDIFFGWGEAELVVPPNAKNIPSLKNITISTWESRGRKKETTSPAWGLVVFGPYVRRQNGLAVNFSNRAEFVQGSLTALHDTICLQKYSYQFKMPIVKKMQMYIKWVENKIWFLSKIYIKRLTAKKIVTVSEFSKKDLYERKYFPKDKIVVIGNGWEHINSIKAVDEARDERIRCNEFYFSIGNLLPHKNLQWILGEAENLKDSVFVIAGKIPDHILKYVNRNLPNVIMLGYISDEYMKYLMLNCKALLFPSLVEGFGIPPLEAIALGSKAIVSDIPVMHEIFGDTVAYIDPYNCEIDLDKILNIDFGNAKKVLDKNSWDVSAKKWYELILHNNGV